MERMRHREGYPFPFPRSSVHYVRLNIYELVPKPSRSKSGPIKANCCKSWMDGRAPVPDIKGLSRVAYI